MICPRTSHGLVKHLAQLFQRNIGIFQPQLRHIPKLGGKALQSLGVHYVLNVLYLLFGGIEGALDICRITVCYAVCLVAHVFENFHVHQLNGGFCGTHQRQHILNILAALEIQHIKPFALHVF